MPTRAQEAAATAVDEMGLDDHGADDLVFKRHKPSTTAASSGAAPSTWARLKTVVLKDAAGTFTKQDLALVRKLLDTVHLTGGAAEPRASAHSQAKQAEVQRKWDAAGNNGALSFFENGAMYSEHPSSHSILLSPTWCRAGVDDPNKMMFLPGGQPTATAHMAVARTVHMALGRAPTGLEVASMFENLGALVKVENKMNGFTPTPKDAKKKGYQEIDEGALSMGCQVAGHEFALHGARGCQSMLSEGVAANASFWAATKQDVAVVHTFSVTAMDTLRSLLNHFGGPKAMADKVPNGCVRITCVGKDELRHAVFSVDDTSAASFVYGRKGHMFGEANKTEIAMRAVGTSNIVRLFSLGERCEGATFLGWEAGSPIFDAVKNHAEYERVYSLLLAPRAVIKYDSMCQYAARGGRDAHLWALYEAVAPMAKLVEAGKCDWLTPQHQESWEYLQSLQKSPEQLEQAARETRAPAKRKAAVKDQKAKVVAKEQAVMQAPTPLRSAKAQMALTEATGELRIAEAELEGLGGGEAAVRLAELDRLRALSQRPSREEKHRLAELEKTEEADELPLPAALRLARLAALRAVAKPSAQQAAAMKRFEKTEEEDKRRRAVGKAPFKAEQEATKAEAEAKAHKGRGKEAAEAEASRKRAAADEAVEEAKLKRVIGTAAFEAEQEATKAEAEAKALKGRGKGAAEAEASRKRAAADEAVEEAKLKRAVGKAAFKAEQEATKAEAEAKAHKGRGKGAAEAEASRKRAAADEAVKEAMRNRPGGDPKNPAAASAQGAEFDCPCGARLCIAIGYRMDQLDANGAPKHGEVAARVKGPDNRHKACFGGSRPSRNIVNETITWSENSSGKPLAGWTGPKGPIPIVRINRAGK